jgi:hypothetical protein
MVHHRVVLIDPAPDISAHAPSWLTSSASCLVCRRTLRLSIVNPISSMTFALSLTECTSAVLPVASRPL